jgi:hypothetical protein
VKSLASGRVATLNGELPLIAVAGTGSAMLAGIHIYERRAEAAMRASRVRLALTFPSGVDPLQAKAALAGVAGLPDRFECIFEVAATGDGIKHFLLVPAAVRESVVATLTGAMPGLRTEDTAAPGGRATLSAKVFVKTPTVLTTDDPEAASRTLLSGVAGLAPGEHAIVRFALRAASPRPWQAEEPANRAAREVERAWRQKTGSGAGFQVAALAVVRATSVARARGLCEHLTSSLRARRGSVGSLRITTERGNRALTVVPKTTRSSGWLTASEVLGLIAWPMGDQPVPGVAVGAARQLPVARPVPHTGRRLLVGRDHRGNPRPVALSHEAARLHLGMFGSTGSGKTTVLIRLILDALAEGVGGLYLDPKDGAATLIDHVPAEYADRVVVLDPSQPSAVPGLDLFGSGDPVLRSDVILSVLRSISEGWGSRIDRFLRIGLRSLSVLPEPVLADWLRVYNDPAVRREVTSRITDPIILAEWHAFEALSPAEQQTYVAPAMARITDLLSRPALRNVLNQPDPRLDIGRLLTERKWLVVALSPGTLGEPAARLLGAVVLYLAWSAVEKRAAVPENKRHQVMSC